ncbi:hypothetical protein HF521_016864 [Silurus meridionalis]|uniref:Protein kinase domain-containing protein n=1 Tax=Silurus meridionalis TaxID=175797 RepID=A0A8T0BQE5_SILME|nr:hypothetical protein HF521_016864 [Silurus meridionalis]
MLPWIRDLFSLLDSDICWMRYFGQEENKTENKAPSAGMFHKKFLYINQHTGCWNIKDRAHDQPKSSFRGKRKSDNLPNEYEPHQKRQKKQIIEEKTDVSNKTKLVLYINQHTGSWNIKKRAHDQPKSSFRGKRKPDNLHNEYEPHQKRQKKQIIEEKTDVSNTNKLPPKHLGIAHLLEVYETRELLGKGGFGSVYAGVVKQMDCQLQSSTSPNVKHLKNWKSLDMVSCPLR